MYVSPAVSSAVQQESAGISDIQSANMQRGQESDNHEATALQDTGCFLWERQASASLFLAVRIDTKMTADKTVQTDNLKHSHYQ